MSFNWDLSHAKILASVITNEKYKTLVLA